jgi:DNA-dependent protein kinase catalytic subunit
VIDTFLRAFSCLGQPRKMLCYFVKKLEKLLSVERPNHDRLCHIYDTMMKELFPSSLGKIHGALFKDIQEYRKQFEKAESAIKHGNKKVIKDLHLINEKVEGIRQAIKPSMQLKDYSPWLSEFQAGNHGSLELEIPGQYTGESKPLIQHHIKMVGFEQIVSLYRYCSTHLYNF